MTPEQREKLTKYRQQVERGLPELRQQAAKIESELRASAMLEPTISGQLRQAIAESGLDHRELASRTGLSPKAIAEFLVGASTLDSGAIDKLGAILNRELRPIV